MQTAIIFRNYENGVVKYSVEPNKNSHDVVVVAIPDAFPLHTTHEGKLAVYIGKEKLDLTEAIATAYNTQLLQEETKPLFVWKEESGDYSVPLTITWDSAKQ